MLITFYANLVDIAAQCNEDLRHIIVVSLESHLYTPWRVDACPVLYELLGQVSVAIPADVVERSQVLPVWDVQICSMGHQ